MSNQIIKVSEATDSQLNWLAGKCETYNIQFKNSGVVEQFVDHKWVPFEPSSDLAQGIPIIFREKIAIVPMGDLWCAFSAHAPGGHNSGYDGGRYIDVTDMDADGTGPTPLIAGLRCRIALKLGYLVEVPLALL